MNPKSEAITADSLKGNQVVKQKTTAGWPYPGSSQ
jgi:hypothetical protein